MGEPDFIGQGGDEFVASGGKSGGDAVLSGGETGKNQEAVISQWFLPVGWEAHIFKTSRGADDDGLASAQEDAQTFFFHWGMKTADDAATGIAPAGGLVVGAENGISRAAGGAEERGLGSC